MDDFRPRIIFRDPVFDGAADPTVIRRASDGKLFMFYTQRRAALECPPDSVEWCYGTKIGVAVCDEAFCRGQPGEENESAGSVKAGSAGAAVCNCHPEGEARRIPRQTQTSYETRGIPRRHSLLGMTDESGGFDKWEYVGALTGSHVQRELSRRATPFETEGLSASGEKLYDNEHNNPSVILGFASDAASPYTGEAAGRLREAGDSSPEGLGMTEGADGSSVLTAEPSRRLPLKGKDSDTFWAPEVIFDGENYRMFVTYIDGVYSEWAGEASIEQYISPDLLEWRRVGRVEIESSRVIDPCLYPLPSGGWRMWFKDERRGSRTCYCDTEDFLSWRYGGFATDGTPQEGPNVFALGGYFWLVADVWDGLAVYRSDDLVSFTRQEGNILPGAASHADVFCEGGTARLVYFTYPEGGRRSAVCECELTVEDGALKAV